MKGGALNLRFLSPQESRDARVMVGPAAVKAVSVRA